jgi:hypothetical protein
LPPSCFELAGVLDDRPLSLLVVVFFAARGFEAFEEEFFLTVFVGDFGGGIE